MAQLEQFLNADAGQAQQFDDGPLEERVGARRPSRQDLLALKGQTLRIPELLAMFGERVRNYQTVPVIQEALQEVGLETHPSFTTCGLTTDMLVVKQNAAPVAEDEAEDEDEVQRSARSRSTS